MNTGGLHDMNEFSDTVTYNLYAQTCKVEGNPRTQKTSMGVRCNKYHSEWTKKSSGYKDLV